ncbi:ATP-dependent DNA ligase Cdc17 [Schizosaccharomyces octosporus yFS286]|uniref:DNA ligase n=1 Tax=Schizosaccharomyces octosporus (strain yFS286) TaxID=483514 RepID=S9R9H1_SCHOY|nr:ATP-dependent DNA ligase Cdc17 [Schizosaccharomyces octosporus yFS286]EPX74815.1 ATP-dependent DNA ligase Cdc17 [Schizosaccharomyces octosporus yFS286]
MRDIFRHLRHFRRSLWFKPMSGRQSNISKFFTLGPEDARKKRISTPPAVSENETTSQTVKEKKNVTVALKNEKLTNNGEKRRSDVLESLKEEDKDASDTMEVKRSKVNDQSSASSTSSSSNPISEGDTTPSDIPPIAETPLESTKKQEKKKSHATFADMVSTFTKIEKTSKRLEIIDIMGTYFFSILRNHPDDLLTSVYLSINKLGPDYSGIELGIGESIIMKAVAESTGQTLQQIKQAFHKVGDLGLVAQSSRQNQPTMFQPAALTLPFLFDSLKSIAQMSGNQSQNRKIGLIKRLLSSCQGAEPKYLIRALEGKLRLQLAEKTILVSLANACAQYHADKKHVQLSQSDRIHAEQTLRDVYSQVPSYDIIVPQLIEHGVENLRETCKLTPGVPTKPMLAKPTKQFSEVLDTFDQATFTCEYKYDGERAQVHYTEDGKFYVFSRNSEDMSVRYPDIMASVPKWRKPEAKSFILDCEAIAWDKEENRILPFQKLATRKRKDVKLEEIKVRAGLFAFDILYLNGQSLLDAPFSERRKHLYSMFQPVTGEFDFAKRSDQQSVESIQEFLEESVKDSCEGLMVKMLEGPESRYEPSKRSRHWLKIKKDYLSGVGDSLDLIVVGAYHGRGKRTSVYGAFLLGCHDPDSETIQTVCKLGTGFSEEQLEQFHKQLSQIVIPKKKDFYSHSEAPPHQPDVWFEPKYLWEVLTADLSLSPVYKAAIGYIQEDKGISLRFPRFVRVREDKNWEDATTSEQVSEFYRSQMVHNQTSARASSPNVEEY